MRWVELSLSVAQGGNPGAEVTVFGPRKASADLLSSVEAPHGFPWPSEGLVRAKNSLFWFLVEKEVTIFGLWKDSEGLLRAKEATCVLSSPQNASREWQQPWGANPPGGEWHP